MSLTVLCSTNGFFVLILRIFNFFICEQNCIFYEFILFPCQIITLLTSPKAVKHSRKVYSSGKKSYLDKLIVFVE